MYLFSEINLFPLILLLALWTIGGWLICARCFDLPAHERGLVSVGLGLIMGTWLANWLARFLPPTYAFWGAALLTVMLGVVLAWPLKRDLFPRETFQPGSWLVFIIFVIVFTLIGRGFAFFDDHQNLAPVSIMATGDIPPHFSYNPDLRFGYHYFLLLVASQFVRLASAGPWMALDLARGISLALTLAYGGFVAVRITRSSLAGLVSMVFMAFAGGARWLFLLMPLTLQRHISTSVHLIGSGAASGPNLITAMDRYWNIEGLGPLHFPFMFGSGLDASFSMFHNGWGTSAITMALLLLLLGGLRRNWQANIPIVILIASMALANEVTFAFVYLGLIFAALAWIIKSARDGKPSLRLPRSMWIWVGLMFVGGVLALVQGGMFTEIARGWLEKQASGTSTYFKVGFALGAPTLLSAHLGYLSLVNPLQWVAVLGETGLAVFAVPIVLRQLVVFPIAPVLARPTGDGPNDSAGSSTATGTIAGNSTALASGLVHDENWFEAALIGSVIVSLLMVFVQYTGNAGPTAASRMQAHFLTVVKIYAVPLLWVWASGRGDKIKMALFAWGLATIFSGISLFGMQIAAMPKPVYAIYLQSLDAQMFSRQWDRLAPNTMVFDPVYPRAATIFGRPIRSSKTMGETLPEWSALKRDPDPYRLKAAGYDYLYIDFNYLSLHSKVIQQSCVKLVDQLENKNHGKVVGARYLFSVTDCR